MNRTVLALVLGLTCGGVMGAAPAQYSPYVGEDFPRNVYWGDTHLHSSLSSDAFGLGVSLGPEAAFSFASGNTVTTTGGIQARLSRPLDFMVLADHAESLGMMNLVKAGDSRVLADVGRKLHIGLNCQRYSVGTNYSMAVPSSARNSARNFSNARHGRSLFANSTLQLRRNCRRRFGTTRWR